MGYNMFAYCGNNPIMLSDPSGEFFLTALIVIGVGAFVSAGTGAYIAACDGGDTGDIIEGAIEGGLIGAAVGTIAYFTPQIIAVTGSSFSATLVAGGIGFASGTVIDLGVQSASYGIRHGTLDGFALDVERLMETAITTALSAMAPVVGDPRKSVADAAKTAAIGAGVTMGLSAITIVYHEVRERGGKGRVMCAY